MEATATWDTWPRRFADFGTIGEALEYAAQGSRGFNFYDAKAELVRSYPFAELLEDARDFARRLLSMGIRPAERVALVAETSPEFAGLFFGTVLAGAWPVPLPLPTSFGGREGYIEQLRNLLASCDPTLVLGPVGLLPLIEAASDGLPTTRACDWCALLPASTTEFELPSPNSDDVAYLQYSSGSTRFPHGVAITHRALLANLNCHSVGMAVQEDDRCISWLPLYHDMGLVGCFLSPVANQLSTDFLATEDFARRPLSWLKLISRHQGHSISYSPTFGYDICARRAAGTDVRQAFDLSRWRVAGNGADMIRPDVMQAFVDSFAPAGFDATAFLPSYGLAEATLAVSIMPVGEGIVTDLVDERLLSGEGIAACPRGTSSHRPTRFRALVNCGRPVHGHRIEVRGEGGEVLADRCIGRILVSGPSVMAGYYGDDQASAAVLKDGWLDTGDMGYLADGYLYVVGRAKDMIIINGKNHWPQDIEWAIEQLPGFKAGDIAAFSVTQPNGEEAPAVLVQCRNSDPEERQKLRKEIAARVRTITGMTCVVELVPPRTLPRTSSGKLSRSKARMLYLSGQIQPFEVAA